MTILRARTFDLPSSVTDWLNPADRTWLWLPSEVTPHDEANARRQLAAWDALAGRLLRASLFADGDARVLRKNAEAVSAVAEQLAVYLDGEKI